MQALATDTIRSTETRLFNGDGCPVNWLWDRVWEMEGRAPTPRSYFERGHLSHSMIETYLNTGDIDAAWEVWAKYEFPDGEWLETTKCTKEGLLDEVSMGFDAWLAQYERLEEYEDVVSIDTEVLLECETPNGTLVSTTADAILTFDESIAVVDWKFGTSRSGKAMQLYLYWYCMRRLGLVSNDAPFRAWFHYVTYANPITHIIDYPGDGFIEAYVDEADFRRKEGPYLPNPDWFECSQCEHKDKCPLWGGDYAETQEVEVVFV